MAGPSGSHKSRIAANGAQTMTFPLASLLQPAKGASTWMNLSCILMIAGLFRWSIGFWGFSGFQKPPMYGDFEAQRHWIELTSHLPVSKWYFYDLEWWGLDYPPLTAYHSWIMGKIGNAIDPTWFALHTSRGLETQDLKVFMRATVIISEYLIYIPAVVICVRRLARLESINTWESAVALTAILMQPATMLIDHGHFQYNTVMLGFVAATAAALYRGHHGRACIWFVASLGFKQMALFYAPAVFSYLLGVCIFPKIDIGRFVTISIYTVLAFAGLITPFVLGILLDVRNGVSFPKEAIPQPWLHSLPLQITDHPLLGPVTIQLAQAIHRIFPFARGLFEDKVANIWCAIHSSGLYKLNRTDPATMGRYALIVTALAILPGCLITFLRPRKTLLLWSLATCSWGFFLASYQVHEKNVLLPLLPMTLLLAGHRGLSSCIRAWVGYANLLGAWTMFPLLERDDLRIPYAVVTLLWVWLLGLPPVSLDAYFPATTASSANSVSAFGIFVHLATYAAMVAWHVAKATLKPPARFPDLFVVGNVCIGTAGFGICYLWCLWNLALRSEVLPGWAVGRKGKVKSL